MTLVSILIGGITMCTAATYKTKDFYFGRTLDYEISYGDQVVITPRNYPFDLRSGGQIKAHYAMIGMACVMQDYPLYYIPGEAKAPETWSLRDLRPVTLYII